MSDNGRFLWHKKPPQNFCVQMLAKSQPRLDAAHPASRGPLTNIQYTPVQRSAIRSPTALTS